MCSGTLLARRVIVDGLLACDVDDAGRCEGERCIDA